MVDLLSPKGELGVRGRLSSLLVWKRLEKLLVVAPAQRKEATESWMSEER